MVPWPRPGPAKIFEPGARPMGPFFPETSLGFLLHTYVMLLRLGVVCRYIYIYIIFYIYI